MYIFLTIEFALGLLIGLALRASRAERAQLRFWQSPDAASATESRAVQCSFADGVAPSER
jgi:hypothetical protein